MRTRAAVALAADQPLEIMEVNLEGLRIPEHSATDSDNIRPPVPIHSATCDVLP